MFTLADLTTDERHTLARKAKADPVYLWQCGAGLRTPSLALAERLISHDTRLTIASLLAPKRTRLQKQKKINTR
jgi:hypothetical protein